MLAQLRISLALMKAQTPLRCLTQQMSTLLLVVLVPMHMVMLMVPLPVLPLSTPQRVQLLMPLRSSLPLMLRLRWLCRLRMPMRLRPGLRPWPWTSLQALPLAPFAQSARLQD
mmetsp:Transcript_35440/g.77928  ORF Transcript_35440/g.77928 Transcript_35440/m.77928 type:complete len:113 (+) Transcript_35440:156-494(+)